MPGPYSQIIPMSSWVGITDLEHRSLIPELRITDLEHRGFIYRLRFCRPSIMIAPPNAIKASKHFHLITHKTRMLWTHPPCHSLDKDSV